MPLSQAMERERIYVREIICEGYLRPDGLWDIEGSLCDTKTYPVAHPLQERRKAGAPVHDMKARVTIGSDRRIRAVEVAMDAYPFAACPESKPNYQRLVGQELGPGFTKNLHKLVGNADGCTHVVWLFQCIARAALQTLNNQVAREQGYDRDAIFGRRGESERPALIDSCHAYAADGEVVKEHYPEHYRGPCGRD